MREENIQKDEIFSRLKTHIEHVHKHSNLCAVTSGHQTTSLEKTVQFITSVYIKKIVLVKFCGIFIR